MPNCLCGTVIGNFKDIMTNKYLLLLVEDIPLCLKYNDKIKLCMHSVYHNSIFIILIYPSLLLVTSKLV